MGTDIGALANHVVRYLEVERSSLLWNLGKYGVFSWRNICLDSWILLKELVHESKICRKPLLRLNCEQPLQEIKAVHGVVRLGLWQEFFKIACLYLFK